MFLDPWYRRELTRPLAVSRRLLVGAPGAFYLRDEDRSFLGAFSVAESAALDPEPESRAAGGPDVPRWIGLLPYEAFRGVEGPGRDEHREAPLLSACRWRRYAAVAVEDASGARVEGESVEAVERLVEALEGSKPTVGENASGGDRVSLRAAGQPEPAEVHRVRVERALEWIARGELYQVNLARRFDFEATGHPFELLERLGALGEAPFAAALEWDGLGVVSSSPELFLDHDEASGRVETRPIKGTRPRSTDPATDLSLRVELDSSEKERAELAMVIDLERNDLGRVARTGTVQVVRAPHVISHPTVHHREASVAAWLRPEITRRELLEVTLPSGSVTGAPKRRAMQLIAELEAARRGLYTGALGYRSHSGRLRLSMAIRVLVLAGRRAHYFAGGGIVADSDPRAEVEETLWKAEQLRQLIGSAENWAG